MWRISRQLRSTAGYFSKAEPAFVIALLSMLFLPPFTRCTLHAWLETVTRPCPLNVSTRFHISN